MLKKIASLLLVFLWMFFIFSKSAQNGTISGNFSDEIIIKVVEETTEIERETNEMDDIVNMFSFPLRKCAHFFVYFVLAFLILCALSIWGIKKKTILITILVCILFAISDELHQLFIDGRSCQISDILLDSSASAFSSVLFHKLIIQRSFNEK